MARRLAARIMTLVLGAGASGATAADCAPMRIDGDRIDAPLSGLVGDPGRGRAVAMDRERGDCSICHQMPLPDREFHGTLGPSLDTVGLRLAPAQLRLRVAAPRTLNPETVMPAYCEADGLHRVDPEYAGTSILSAQEIEDLVAWLSTLRGTGT